MDRKEVLISLALAGIVLSVAFKNSLYLVVECFFLYILLSPE